MSEPVNGDSWLYAALAAVAGFAASVVMWVLKRGANREDKETAAREVFMGKLAELPGKLEAVNERHDGLETRVANVERDVRHLRDGRP